MILKKRISIDFINGKKFTILLLDDKFIQYYYINLSILILDCKFKIILILIKQRKKINTKIQINLFFTSIK